MRLSQLLATLVVLIGAQVLWARWWPADTAAEWFKTTARAVGDFSGALSRFSLTVQRSAFEVEHFGHTISAAYPLTRHHYPGVAIDLPARLLQQAHDLAAAADISVEDAVAALRSALVGEAPPARHIRYDLSGAGLMSREQMREAAELPSEVGLQRWSLDGEPLGEVLEVEPAQLDGLAASAGDIIRDLAAAVTRAGPGASFAMPPVSWWSPFDYYGNDPNQEPHGLDGGTPMTLEELLEVDRRLDDIDRRLEGEGE